MEKFQAIDHAVKLLQETGILDPGLFAKDELGGMCFVKHKQWSPMEREQKVAFAHFMASVREIGGQPPVVKIAVWTYDRTTAEPPGRIYPDKHRIIATYDPVNGYRETWRQRLVTMAARYSL